MDLRQGDKVEYGAVRRVHVAQTLVAALTTPAAEAKTVEVFSSEGPVIDDWDQAFAALTRDPGGSDALDGALDPATLPLASEPADIQAVIQRLWTP